MKSVAAELVAIFLICSAAEWLVAGDAVFFRRRYSHRISNEQLSYRCDEKGNLGFYTVAIFGKFGITNTFLLV